MPYGVTGLALLRGKDEPSCWKKYNIFKLSFSIIIREERKANCLSSKVILTLSTYINRAICPVIGSSPNWWIVNIMLTSRIDKIRWYHCVFVCSGLWHRLANLYRIRFLGEIRGYILKSVTFRTNSRFINMKTYGICVIVGLC